jgi:formylglycine-generating enzyme required for sulfatase activity
VALAYERIDTNADWTPIMQEFDGVEMVLVPVGCFKMGSIEGDRDEVPLHEQCFDQPFWIDRYEVSNEQFASLSETEACSEASSEPDQPRNCVAWFEAAAHCEERGTRLPTEAEWEYAARGPDALVFPWGIDFDPDDAVYGANSRRQTASVGSRPAGASWVGSLDMIGNVWEWVNTIYDQDQFPYPFNPDDGRADSRDHDSSRVLRGGSFPDITNIRAANRNYNYPDEAGIGDGFRCARDFDASS